MAARDDTGAVLGSGWLPSTEVRLATQLLLRTQLGMPDLTSYSSWVAENGLGNFNGNRALYSDLLYDLTQLLEEFSFQAAVATLYVTGLRDVIDAASERHHNETMGLGIPPVVRSLLATNRAYLPEPFALLADPAADVAGHRVLGGWWAGQLIDSAIVRGHSALDRVVALMTCAADPEGNIDRDYLPSFNSHYLTRLEALAPGRSGLGDLRALLSDSAYLAVHNYRDGIVHRQRRPMYLHGDYFEFTPQARTPGHSVDEHMNLPLGFHSNVIIRAVHAGAQFVAAP